MNRSTTVAHNSYIGKTAKKRSRWDGRGMSGCERKSASRCDVYLLAPGDFNPQSIHSGKDSLVSSRALSLIGERTVRGRAPAKEESFAVCIDDLTIERRSGLVNSECELTRPLLCLGCGKGHHNDHDTDDRAKERHLDDDLDYVMRLSVTSGTRFRIQLIEAAIQNE